jgi:hypothetical protein
MKLDAWMAHQPALDGRGAVRREIVEHDVDVEAWVDTRFDLPQEADEILGAVLCLAARNDLPGGDIERGEQVQRAMPDVVCVRRSGCPKSIGRIGCARWSAWIWDFSSRENTTALAGGAI